MAEQGPFNQDPRILEIAGQARADNSLEFQVAQVFTRQPEAVHDLASIAAGVLAGQGGRAVDKSETTRLRVNVKRMLQSATMHACVEAEDLWMQCGERRKTDGSPFKSAHPRYRAISPENMRTGIEHASSQPPQVVEWYQPRRAHDLIEKEELTRISIEPLPSHSLADTISRWFVARSGQAITVQELTHELLSGNELQNWRIDEPPETRFNLLRANIGQLLSGTRPAEHLQAQGFVFQRGKQDRQRGQKQAVYRAWPIDSPPDQGSDSNVMATAWDSPQELAPRVVVQSSSEMEDVAIDPYASPPETWRPLVDCLDQNELEGLDKAQKVAEILSRFPDRFFAEKEMADFVDAEALIEAQTISRQMVEKVIRRTRRLFRQNITFLAQSLAEKECHLQSGRIRYKDSKPSARNQLVHRALSFEQPIVLGKRSIDGYIIEWEPPFILKGF
jgi:hypothetical protein